MSAEVRRATKAVLTTTAALLAICVPSALALPAGRGYEKVSPNDKDGQDILNGLDKAAADGNAATYISFGAFADSEGGGLVTSFHSDRSATDWAHAVARPAAGRSRRPRRARSTQDFSDDVSTSIVSYLAGDPGFGRRHSGHHQPLPPRPGRQHAPAHPGPAAAAAGTSSRPPRPGAAAPDDMSIGTFS